MISSKPLQRVIDLAILSFVLWAAFLLRFDGDIPVQYFKRLLFLWPYVVVLQYASMAVWGIPRISWQYVALRDVTRILVSLGLASTFLLILRLGAPLVGNPVGPLQYLQIPIGIVLIDFVLAFLFIVGVRVVNRLVMEHTETARRKRGKEETPTLLIGAGQMGVVVVKEIARWPGLGIRPVGFVDDDPTKLGTVVHGIKVLGTTAQIPRLIDKYEIKQALITIANARGRDIRRISEICETADVPAKIIPGIYEILGGKLNLNLIRDVSIEDLLRREVVKLDSIEVGEMIADQCVLVSGAGGSIGAEICRQVTLLGPSKVLLVERSEWNLFEIHHELVRHRPKSTLVPLLCDICDRDRLTEIFEHYRPQIVFHAAAYKHVPMVEWNPGEAVKNNVFGTKTIAEVSLAHGVDAFVNISTDKAVNPTSVMGATKRLAELVIQRLAESSTTRFVSVRFGNVLGSTGSVIPIFKAQIADGGPVTVTHPEMKRYFMTIPEATELVLQSAALGESGDIFILDMGEPVKIVDLARDLIRLSGLEPESDIPIVYTGVRPGEKLFEELGFDPKTMNKTRHPHIFVLTRESPKDSSIEAFLKKFDEIGSPNDLALVRSVLSSVLPEMQADQSDLAPISTPSSEDTESASTPAPKAVDRARR